MQGCKEREGAKELELSRSNLDRQVPAGHSPLDAGRWSLRHVSSPNGSSSLQLPPSQLALFVRRGNIEYALSTRLFDPT
jgi:hypothetical protein